MGTMKRRTKSRRVPMEFRPMGGEQGGEQGVDVTKDVYAAARVFASDLNEAMDGGFTEEEAMEKIRAESAAEAEYLGLPAPIHLMLFNAANRWIERPCADNGWRYTVIEGNQLEIGTFGNWPKGTLGTWAP